MKPCHLHDLQQLQLLYGKTEPLPQQNYGYWSILRLWRPREIEKRYRHEDLLINKELWWILQ